MLPSGLKLSISKGHILQPDINWFRAPDGHFWYWNPAPENPPPFTPYQVWMRQSDHAPVPQSKEEMSKFILVLIMRDDGKYYWQGDYLYEFPFFMVGLSKEDLRAWEEWVITEPVQQFLDTAIKECQIQSEINKGATGQFSMNVPVDSNGEWVDVEYVVDNPFRNKQ